MSMITNLESPLPFSIKNISRAIRNSEINLKKAYLRMKIILLKQYIIYMNELI